MVLACVVLFVLCSNVLSCFEWCCVVWCCVLCCRVLKKYWVFRYACCVV